MTDGEGTSPGQASWGWGEGDEGPRRLTEAKTADVQ